MSETPVVPRVPPSYASTLRERRKAKENDTPTAAEGLAAAAAAAPPSADSQSPAPRASQARDAPGDTSTLSLVIMAASLLVLLAAIVLWGPVASHAVEDLKNLAGWSRPSRLEELTMSYSERISNETEELVRINAKIYAKVTADPTFTRFEDSNMYFRVLPRRAPLDADGKPIRFLLYQLVNESREMGFTESPEERLKRMRLRVWRSSAGLKGDRTQALVYGRDLNASSYTDSWGLAEYDPITKQPVSDEEKARIPCVGAGPPKLVYHIISVLLHNRVRTDSTYPASYPLSRGVGDRSPCLNRLLPMMCAGDKWEVLCPPEMEEGEEGYTRGGVLPHASIVHRVDVRDTHMQSEPLSYAEEEVAFSCWDEPNMTRWKLLDKVRLHKSTVDIFTLDGLEATLGEAE